MSAVAVLAVEQPAQLPAMVDRAARALAGARDAAEVLEARDAAAFAYDAAKRMARLARAKGAHDTLIAAAHRAQADALDIEAQAKRRLADEYDAAQERGEVAKQGQRTDLLPDEKKVPTPADLGLTHKQVHEARQVRDAEAAEPGIVRRVLDEKLERGEEPTKAALRQAVIEAAQRGLRPAPPQAGSRRNPIYEPNPQFDAMLVVAAGCRDIMERAGHHAPDYLLGGFLDDAMRRREIAAIRRCRDFLTVLLEVADA